MFKVQQDTFSGSYDCRYMNTHSQKVQLVSLLMAEKRQSMKIQGPHYQ